MFTFAGKNLFFIVFIAAIFCTFTKDAEAKRSAPILLEDNTEKQNMYPAIDMIKDRTKELTIDEVTSESFADQFIQSSDVKQKAGFFDTSTWLRFEVDNQSNQHEWILEFAFPLIYDIQIYAKEHSGLVTLFKGGADYPFNEREIEHRNFIFNIEIEPGQSKTFYVVAAGGGDLHPPINIWNKDTFIEKTQKESALLGIFYGIIIVMIIYNFFLYLSLRMKSYLYYVLAISFTLLGKLSINGLGFQYIWPHAPEWNRDAASFWVSIACIFILIFSKNFLDVKRNVPRFNKLFYLLMIFNASVIVVLQFAHYIALTLMVIASFCTFITVLLSALLSLKRGARQARFYIVGWFVFLTGVFITMLGRTSLYPYSYVTEYAGQAALTMEVVLLSFALADKISIMRREKEDTEKRLQESQELAIENLKKADELKDEFLAVTSHELRTPLYGIVGIAESLRDGITGDISSELKSQLSMIVTSGHRLTHLVNDILDFSKLKYDSLMLQLKPVYLHSVVDIVIAISKPSLKNKPVRLINDINSGLPPIRADEYRIQQIIQNLLDNAIKYTDEGEISISATVNIDEDVLTIHITDTGHGIPHNKLDVIFQPFQQGDASIKRNIGGVGIGLNITKRLIDLHNGHLEVTSKVGKGSTFSVTFPIFQDVMSYKNEIAATTNKPLSEEPTVIISKVAELRQNKPTVLVVDDEAVNLQVLMNQLSLNGYNVLMASGGKDALQIIDKENIDLLILDIMMPGISGYKVCRQVRKNYSLMDLPILMLTAKNQQNDKTLAFETGANDYLVKPCNKQELLSRVKTLIQAKLLNQDLIQLNLDLEERINERTKELEVANDNLHLINGELLEMTVSRSQLLANVAHELGTPITLIQNYIQSLHNGLISIEDPHYQGLVFDKINVLNRLIDDLYDLSKLESGTTSLNPKEIRLDTWIKQLYNRCEMTVLLENRHFISTPIPTEFKHFSCTFDIERMDQLFSNLISNAIKHTSSVFGKIKFKAKIDDSSSLIIQVKDNGIGINKENLPFIFERFYKQQSSSSNEKQTGSGLGLAIVKQIIESHKGQINVESEENKGTSFIIKLPVKYIEDKQ